MPPTEVVDPPPPPPSTRNAGVKQRGVEVVGYDQYVDDRIRRTRRMVKLVDIAEAFVMLAVGWVALLALSAFFEHWVIRGGFTDGGRYALFGAALASSVGLLAVRLTPLLTRRVNPIYAANAIEQTTPSLKNTLVNLLLLRRDGRAANALSEELEREAAQRIAQLGGDASVDRGGVIRWGYALIGMLVLLVGYSVLSPKNPFATAARVMAPWADIAAPTRVRILEVKPGSVEVAQGEFVTITALIRDLGPQEQAWLVTSTADRQQREQRAPLQTTDGVSFQLRLPAGGTLGVQQDIAYRIEAGDARSRRHRLRVVTAPSIVVRNVYYDYPDYTGYLDRNAPNAADLRAIEGTRVRIDAAANLPIDAAQIDLNADGSPDLRMEVAGDAKEARAASAAFTLALRPDRRTPKHNAYALRLTTVDGRANSDPIAHRIDVVADLAPEVELTEPKEPIRDVRVDETVVIRFWARDPDFGLASLKVQGERIAGESRSGGVVFKKELLDRRTERRFEGRYRFRPSDHGLKSGDVVEYTAIATDVKQPDPQRVAARPQRFRIIGGGEEAGAEREQDRSENGQQGEPGKQDKQANDGRQQNDEQQDGGQSDPNGQSGVGGENQRGAEDPNGQQGKGQEQSGQQQNRQQQREGQRQQDQEQQRDGQAGQNEQQGEQQQNQGQQENQSQSGRDNGAGGIKGEQTEGGGDAAQDNSSGGGGQGESGQRDQQEPGSNGAGNGDARNADGTNQGENRQPNEPGGPGGDSQSSASSEGGQQGEQTDQTPVAKDGENDAAAFERIREFLDQENQGDSKLGGSRQSADNNSASNNNENTDQPNAKRQSGERPNDNGADRSSGAQGRADGKAADRGAEDSGTESEGSPTSPNNSQEQSDALGANEPQSQAGGEKGRGEQAPRDGTGSAGETNSADDGQGRAADRGAGDTAASGGDRETADEPTGKSSQDQRGNGSKQREASEGKPGAGEGEQASRDSAQSEQAGDTNQAGSEAAADSASEPQGRSAEGGDQRTGSEQAGSEQAHNKEAGEERRKDRNASRDATETNPSEADGEQAGRGQQRPGSNQGSSEDPPNGRAADAADQPVDKSTERGRTDPSNQNDGKGATAGGSRDGRPRGSRNGKTPAGDKANLDYTRQQTDLILDELSDRLRDKNVDRELLDKLGWSEADLQRFVDRWQSLKRKASKSSAARAELDQELRSLGLSPGRLDGRVERASDNQRVGAGYRGKTPAAVRERLRAYNAGVSRGSGNDDKR